MEQEDFIRVYDNGVSKEFCVGLIQYFNWCLENNKTWDRLETTANFKKDKSTVINPSNVWEIDFTNNNLAGYIREFNEAFWGQAYPHYTSEFDTLNAFQKHGISTYKIQKTIPGGGYHVWHAEQDSIDHSRRIAAYVLYLNDVPDGGETEFLYQSKRVEPKEGRLVIFPAGYTHTHRGNPPLRGEKYILTGWIEFT